MKTDIFESIQLAKSKWNADADEWNQWHELGLDEKLELVSLELYESIHQALYELGEAEEPERIEL